MIWMTSGEISIPTILYFVKCPRNIKHLVLLGTLMSTNFEMKTHTLSSLTGLQSTQGTKTMTGYRLFSN